MQSITPSPKHYTLCLPVSRGRFFRVSGTSSPSKAAGAITEPAKSVERDLRLWAKISQRWVWNAHQHFIARTLSSKWNVRLHSLSDYNLEHNTGKPRCQTIRIGQHCQSLLSQRRFQILPLQLVSHWILSPVNCRGLLLQCGTGLSDFYFFCTIRSYYHNVGQHCQILLPQCGTALSDLTTTIPDSTVVVIGF